MTERSPGATEGNRAAQKEQADTPNVLPFYGKHEFAQGHRYTSKFVVVAK